MCEGCPRRVRPTRLIDREDEMGELQRAVSANRVVTITGISGVGKTRLAAEVAARLSGEYRDGVGLVDLGIVAEPEMVPSAISYQLGLADRAERTTIATLMDSLAARRILVMLDSCGHLLPACESLITALRDATPNSTILATSREAIGLAGELAFNVRPLPADHEAGTLFAERARIASPSFGITNDNQMPIAEICRRLCGIPGAIELAAARTRTMSASEIRDSLLDWFRLLTGDPWRVVRGMDTMLNTVAWSYRLSTEPERILLRRLAVIRGGFTLDAAQSVGVSKELNLDQIEGYLSLLSDNSLVQTEEIGGTIRYRLSEAVGDYLLEKLAASGEADAVRERYWHHYTAKADAVTEHRGKQLTHLSASDFANLHAAATWHSEALD